VIGVEADGKRMGLRLEVAAEAELAWALTKDGDALMSSARRLRSVEPGPWNLSRWKMRIRIVSLNEPFTMPSPLACHEPQLPTGRDTAFAFSTYGPKRVLTWCMIWSSSACSWMSSIRSGKVERTTCKTPRPIKRLISFAQFHPLAYCTTARSWPNRPARRVAVEVSYRGQPRFAGFAPLD